MDHNELSNKVESLHIRFGTFNLQQVRTRIRRHELTATPEIEAVLEELEQRFHQAAVTRKRLNQLTLALVRERNGG